MNHIKPICKTIILLSLLVFLFVVPSYAANRGIKVVAKTADNKEIALYSESYALIVGNGNYTEGWDPLPGALRDVKEVAEALKRKGFRVTVKTDLTMDEFKYAFGEFFMKYGMEKDNRLLFYYAGHGYTQKLITGEDLGFLVMVDAPVPEKNSLGFDLASVDMGWMVTQAKRINARHALFIFDSCFSGTILNFRERVTPGFISDNVKYPVRQFITAGRASESVPDYSVFKQSFLNLIEGRAREPIPDGYITGEELGLYLKTQVPQYNPNQHPQYGKIRDPKLDQGDFVFVVPEKTAALKKPRTGPEPGQVWKEPTTGMEFVWVPGGCYEMGLAENERQELVKELGDEVYKKKWFPFELPPHEICIDGFWMGKYEVTRGQFRRFIDETGYQTTADKTGYANIWNPEMEEKNGYNWQKTEFKQDDNHPVVNVSWNDAKAFLKWLSDKEGNNFRLPTEAEWEYACRAGTKTARFWGDDPDNACRYANIADQTAKRSLPNLEVYTCHTCDDGFTYTSPVGNFDPNKFGLYDMLGNVWEWCEDRYNIKPITDDFGGPFPAIRGGSWFNGPRHVRCAHRSIIPWPFRFSFNGFRLVRPVKGSINVISDPPGATLYLDGAYVGTTPDEMKRLDKGRYTIAVKKDGYEQHAESVIVRAGEQTNVFARLEPIKTVSGGKVADTWRDPVTGMEFVWVPGGCYQMGSTSGDSDETPIHEVCVDGFWIGRYEVTQGQWKKVTGNNPSYFKSGDTYPVEKVSWDDTKDFISKLTSLNNGRYTLRLPTEAEWEYACRSGGKNDKYPGGGDANQTAWYSNNSGHRTHPVGTKASNSLGIFDMSGNVWEWCEDLYDTHAYHKNQRNNPLHATFGPDRVIRGGSCYSLPGEVRCAFRGRYLPGYGVSDIGFRLVHPVE
jgi:formylglycine-generating enzyme required for sulfatase activity